MLYDYVIMHHLADDKSDIDEPLYLKELKDEKANVFLILLATSSSSNSYNYFYVKRQYSAEPEYFIPYKSKSKMHTSASRKRNLKIGLNGSLRGSRRKENSSPFI